MTEVTEMPNWGEHELIAARRIEFLGAPMHLLTMDETLSLATEAMLARKPIHHTVINVAKLVNMRSNAELREDVSAADLINIDGAGVVWGARLLGIRVPERVAGVDIMENLFAVCAEHGFKPFLLGAEAHVLEAVKARLADEYAELAVAGAQDGYFKPEDEERVVAAINASGADCLFVAMPTPRKERFLRKYRSILRPSFVMGVGGSFDVYGGKVSRAPKLVQVAGLEWLYRVLQEPRRLWRRYYDTNLAYAGLLWSAYWSRGARE